MAKNTKTDNTEFQKVLYSEISTFSRHIMLLLIAAFALGSSNVIKSKCLLVIILFYSSLCLAIFSFSIGFTIYRSYMNKILKGQIPTDHTIPKHEISLFNLQYFLTILSLSLLVASLLSYSATVEGSPLETFVTYIVSLV